MANAGRSCTSSWISAFMVIHLCLLSVNSYVVENTKPNPTWREEKVTRLHFFFHDQTSGANPTAIVAAQPNGTASPFFFGTIVVIDDVLTEGLDRASPVVGNAQGTYTFTGKDSLSLYFTADFGFTTGKFNGSSITIASRNPVLETKRELAVVGGRGMFRMARGFARLTTRKLSGSSAIVEYDVTVFHY